MMIEPNLKEARTLSPMTMNPSQKDTFPPCASCLSKTIPC